VRERGLHGDDAIAVEHLVGYAELAQDPDVLRHAVDLLLRAKQLQRAEAALVVGDARLPAERLQAIAAVLGERHHAALVAPVARLGAVDEHRDDKAPHRGSSRGRTTSGRCRISSHLSALTGTPGPAHGDA